MKVKTSVVAVAEREAVEQVAGGGTKESMTVTRVRASVRVRGTIGCPMRKAEKRGA